MSKKCPMEKLCLAELELSEGYESSGHVTFVCNEKKGHKGNHKEKGINYNTRYIITWSATDLRVR
jgi:hypothetical protein